jgi:3-hydroxyacyl-[acyl-carrier-protein] dehydratase
MQHAGCFIVPANHPCLPGHFPGRPIVPGVVLLDEAFACLRPHLPGQPDLLTAKFTAPVLAGEPVDVAWRRTGPARMEFTCATAGRAVLRGTARLVP